MNPVQNNSAGKRDDSQVNTNKGDEKTMTPATSTALGTEGSLSKAPGAVVASIGSTVDDTKSKSSNDASKKPSSAALAPVVLPGAGAMGMMPAGSGSTGSTIMQNNNLAPIKTPADVANGLVVDKDKTANKSNPVNPVVNTAPDKMSSTNQPTVPGIATIPVE